MSCPRCDGDIERYSLSGSESQICHSCGYVGVPVEHEREPMDYESWDDALKRFFEANGA